MDKKSFLDKIHCEDKVLLSNIYGKILLAERVNKTVYCNEFYTPNIWKSILKMKYDLNVNIYCDGIFEDSERKMLAFSNLPVDKYPMMFIKIVNKSKFNKLKHKDYLGAIMSLGISRGKIGDLIINEEKEECYLAACSDICDYIIYNLNSIGKCPCEIEQLDINKDNLPSYQFETKEVIVTSLRGDCIVSALCNISRAKAVELIKSRKVLFDYEDIYNKDESLEKGCTVIIKKYGKFKILNKVGHTAKDRIKILIKKFI